MGRWAAASRSGTIAYTRRGLYADQLERAAALIGRERLLVLISEEMFADPVAATSAALDFVGATRQPINGVGANDMSFESEPMDAETGACCASGSPGRTRSSPTFLGRELPW